MPEKKLAVTVRRFKPIPSPIVSEIPHKQWKSQRDFSKAAADHFVSGTSLKQRKKKKPAPRLGFTGGTLSNSNVIVLKESYSSH